MPACSASRSTRKSPATIFGDPVVQRRKGIWRVAVGGRRLGFERRAELRLAAGPIEKDDEMARDLHGEFPSEIFLHQREAEIDSGRDSGRCPNPVIVQIDRIWIDLEVRVMLLQTGTEFPVRRGAPPRKHAGFRQKERAGANRCDPARGRELGGGSNRRSSCPCGCVVNSGAARKNECVDGSIADCLGDRLRQQRQVLTR